MVWRARVSSVVKETGPKGLFVLEGGRLVGGGFWLGWGKGRRWLYSHVPVALVLAFEDGG